MHCYVCYWHVLVAIEKYVMRYKLINLGTYHPGTIFTQPEILGSVVNFRNQKESATKNLGKHRPKPFHQSERVPGSGYSREVVNPQLEYGQHSAVLQNFGRIPISAKPPMLTSSVFDCHKTGKTISYCRYDNSTFRKLVTFSVH